MMETMDLAQCIHGHILRMKAVTGTRIMVSLLEFPCGCIFPERPAKPVPFAARKADFTPRAVRAFGA